MKAFLLPLLVAGTLGWSALGGPPEATKPMRHPAPPVFTAAPNAPVTTPAPTSTASYTYPTQSGASRPALVQPEQAKAIIDRFKAGYPRLGGPRLLLYVNRELISESSGLRLVGRTEKVDSLKSDLTPTGTPGAGPLGQNVTVVGNVTGEGQPLAAKGTRDRLTAENSYQHKERPAAVLADRQTVRDVERLMGRPLRLGGAKLTDQRVATQLLADRRVEDFLGTTGSAEAAKDREALQRVADVVVEVLISSRPLAVPGVSGDVTYQVPDIQVTALRVTDAQILGQASSADILGPDRLAGRVARNYDVREITEAVALALMEDMMQVVP
jgi:hypothetical protein